MRQAADGRFAEDAGERGEAPPLDRLLGALSARRWSFRSPHAPRPSRAPGENWGAVSPKRSFKIPCSERGLQAERRKCKESAGHPYIGTFFARPKGLAQKVPHSGFQGEIFPEPGPYEPQLQPALASLEQRAPRTSPRAPLQTSPRRQPPPRRRQAAAYRSHGTSRGPGSVSRDGLAWWRWPRVCTDCQFSALDALPPRYARCRD